MSQWYQSWFDSPYYHKLYKHRDFEEAARFIDNLIAYLKPPRDSVMMDLACGKGRHALYLKQKGYKVVGLDLSPSNIAYAKQFEDDDISFHVHDMRDVFQPNHFDYVFNFFTSFGYFDIEEDHLKTLRAIHTDLKPGGQFIIDFLNSTYALKHLNEEDTQQANGIEFHITRKKEQDKIVKSISFEDDGRSYQFEEKVQALALNDFKRYFDKAGFELQDIFGDYGLNPFDEQASPRLILIAKAT